jgi:hypothetical protein
MNFALCFAIDKDHGWGTSQNVELNLTTIVPWQLQC